MTRVVSVICLASSATQLDTNGAMEEALASRDPERFIIEWALWAGPKTATDRATTLEETLTSVVSASESRRLAMLGMRVLDSQRVLSVKSHLQSAQVGSILDAYRIASIFPGCPSDRELLLNGLSHPTPAVQVEAARWCGNSKAADARPRLTELLESRSPSVALAAAVAIAKLDPTDEDSIRSIERTAARASGQEVCAALEQVGARAILARKAIRRLMVAHSVQVSRVLLKLNRVHLADFVGEILASPDLQEVDVIAEFLSTYDHRLPIAKMRLLELAREADGDATRCMYIRAAARSNDLVVADLHEFAKSPSAQVRFCAIYAAASCDGSAREGYLRRFLNDPDRRVRLLCCVNIQEQTHRKSVEDCLLRLLQSPPAELGDMKVLVGVVRRFPSCHRQACRLLMELVSEPDTDPAVFELFHLLDRERIVPVVQQGLSSEKPAFRAVACRLLASFGGRTHVPEICKLITDRTPVSFSDIVESTVAREALLATSQLGADRSILPELLNCLNNGKVLIPTLRSISSVGPGARRAVPVLMRLELKSTNEEVEVAKALLKLGSPLTASGRTRKVLAALGKMPRSGHWGRPLRLDIAGLFRSILDLDKVPPDLKAAMQSLATGESEIHPIVRVESAYAMAELDPSDPQWQALLETYAGLPNLPSIYDLRTTAARRLRSLETGK